MVFKNFRIVPMRQVDATLPLTHTQHITHFVHEGHRYSIREIEVLSNEDVDITRGGPPLHGLLPALHLVFLAPLRHDLGAAPHFRAFWSCVRTLGVHQTADASQFALCFRGARAVAPPVTNSEKSEAEYTHYIKTIPESTFENVLPGNGEEVDAGMPRPRMVLAHD